MSSGFLISCVLFTLFVSSTYAQSCTKYNFTSNNQMLFTSCSDLPFLNSFLHWNYNPSSKTAKIAYRHTKVASNRWVAWAINPTSQGMVGSQALVAYQKSDGKMRVYTSPITSYQTQLQEGDLSFNVSNLSATYLNNEFTIFATLKLENFNSTFVNQVWQEGPLSGDSPAMHDTSIAHAQSAGLLSLLSGQSRTTTKGASSSLNKKNFHGLLNAVSWGIMMPIGILFARYLKVFSDPAWFYLHSIWQITAYVIGVAGWAIGLQLGSESHGIQYTAHRTIGIVLFSLATLQATAILLRPKRDHKHRIYWNIYHRSVGYSIVVLGIINIFKGLNILKPEKKWETSYIATLVGLGIIAAFLEVITWCVVIKRNKSVNSTVEKNPQGLHEANWYNGNGNGTTGTQYRV
ncbi:cytochrome b561 and DOMON domain-containing protein At5g47530-like [Lycium barbarum]|uniref:cytochrome b561 and DOMON domain-containing protein At5g47530-like n=1 Tax=Lycium barbarum TaxID=112863 RepID=UPI00293E7F54|nr:cytochrome b561 and DOMON domain-containing protein At5g47530-like [Lycium barbarum]